MEEAAVLDRDTSLENGWWSSEEKEQDIKIDS